MVLYIKTRVGYVDTILLILAIFSLFGSLKKYLTTGLFCAIITSPKKWAIAP